MQIHWCLKGIAGDGSFGDNAAWAVMTESGILSNWMRNNPNLPSSQANKISQQSLSLPALDDHVNDYDSVKTQTPYISLSAGCREFAGAYQAPTTYPAFRTALEFATKWGTVPGYIYRCWVVVAPQIAADAPGLADEVRDLNLYADFYNYHREGEITAKLVVPVRQIQWVQKVGPDLKPLAFGGASHTKARSNPQFRRPQSVSNLIPEIA